MPEPHKVNVVDELPQPSAFLNYAGDQRGSIGQVMGPNTLGELLTVVSCEYDETAQRSRVGLAFGVYVRPFDLHGLPVSTERVQ